MNNNKNDNLTAPGHADDEPDLTTCGETAMEYVVGEAVADLHRGMSGRWLVTTRSTRHVWDMDAGTYMRLPGSASKSGAMVHDGYPCRITNVELWPHVGESFLVWFDHHSDPFMDHWRLSSTVASIVKIDSTAEATQQ